MLAKTLLQLFKVDVPITIPVEFLEHVLQLLDILRVRLHCDGRNGDLLYGVRVLELLYVFDVQLL